MKNPTFIPEAPKVVKPGDFEPANHWYPRALNAQIHPLVAYFMGLSNEQIVNRYCHLNPMVKREDLTRVLSYKPKHFVIAGSDLFYVTSEKGKRQMVVIETNSSPSGQKSMPILNEEMEQGGYQKYISETFAPFIAKKRKVQGGLAVLYDKNFMEASGYASAMADYFQEEVHIVPLYKHDPDPPARFDDGILHIRKGDGTWIPIRAAHRYVTQKPWTRVPIHTKTHILNPMIACLAGGRNKMVAAKAYDFYNAELATMNMRILYPETIRDVSKTEIPLWFEKFGGHAVIKDPYSNAGQGVFTITSQQEFEEFMAQDFEYEMFIVQSLIGNYSWSSVSSQGKFYHVGTMPNRKGKSFVADIRMMVHGTPDGIRPMACYARRSRTPLVEELSDSSNSWDMLGTNLSLKNEDGSFSTDDSRLILMDRRDFNKLGVGIDELIEGFIQSALCMIAIDKMCQKLFNQKGQFRKKLFRSLDQDSALMNELKY